MSKRYICPFCFDEYDMNQVEFECEQRYGCKVEEDKNYEEWAGTKNEMRPHHFAAPSGGFFSKWSMPQSAQCDLCNHVSHTRVCPGCHNVLPRTIDTNEELIIALVGSRGSGKSTYIGVLIHEMIKHLFLNFDGTFNLLSDEDQKRYHDDFEQGLYIDHRLLDQTRRATHGRSGRGKKDRPILGTLKMPANGMFKKTRSVTLVFFDSAGEDWTDEQALRTVAKYLKHAAGIIFLIDPLTNGTVYKTIGKENLEGSIGSDDIGNDGLQSQVLTNAMNVIRNERELKEDQPIDTPVAVAFPKLDVLDDNGLLQPGMQLKKPSPHAQLGHFDEADRESVNEEMRSMLGKQWDEGNFLTMLDQNFVHNSCFAFSALGRKPSNPGAKKIETPTPIRIEDAMFWILHEYGVL